MELSKEAKENVEERIKQGKLRYEDLSELVKTEPFRNGLLYLLLDTWFENKGNYIESSRVKPIPDKYKNKK
jgi:hypothetical protein